MPAGDRLSKLLHINTVPTLMSSHYPPEYHSFMYSATLASTPRTARLRENFIFYDGTSAWTVVLPIMLVTRTTILDSAAVMLLSSGVNNLGDQPSSLTNSAVINYGWLRADRSSVTASSSSANSSTVAGAVANVSWTAGSTTLTVTSKASGTIAIGQTLFTNANQAQQIARSTVQGMGIIAQLTGTAGGAGTYTLSSAPTASGSNASVDFYPPRPQSELSDLLYSDSSGNPYLIYGNTGVVSTGPTLDEGFTITYPQYDTGASEDLLGPEAWDKNAEGAERGPHYDLPASGEAWGAAASYPLLNNSCVVDRAGGGDRGIGKALALVARVGGGSSVCPEQIRNRLGEMRMLITIRHRSSFTGGR